ncbi:menaquinone-dependent protoporphyrinogen IX oxidase [Aeribacillus sp. SP014]|jgi:hypothetical protein
MLPHGPGVNSGGEFVCLYHKNASSLRHFLPKWRPANYSSPSSLFLYSIAFNYKKKKLKAQHYLRRWYMKIAEATATFNDSAFP